MELGALVCVAGTPALCRVPGAGPLRVAAAPAPPPPTGHRGGCSASPAPTGRCADGCWTCCGRRTSRSGAEALVPAWDDAAQRSRCLDSLLVDGLVVQTEDGRFSLPDC